MQTLDFTKMSIRLYASNTYNKEERSYYANIVKEKLEENGFIVKKHYSQKGSMELLFDIDVEQTLINLKHLANIIGGGGLFMFAIKRLAGKVIDKYLDKILDALKHLKLGKTSEPTGMTILTSKELGKSVMLEKDSAPIFPTKLIGKLQILKLTIICENEEKGTLLEGIFTEDHIENVKKFEIKGRAPIESQGVVYIEKNMGQDDILR